jgi:uncharacterized membrane protein
MTVDLVLQENGIFATLVGILGGFSFAAVMQLIESPRKGKLATALTILFSLVTFMFLLALLVFVVTYAVVAETNQTFTELATLGAYALFDTYAAIFLLLAGIGLAGWVRSKATGIVTTIFALIFMCLSLLALFWLFQVLGLAMTGG